MKFGGVISYTDSSDYCTQWHVLEMDKHFKKNIKYLVVGKIMFKFFLYHHRAATLTLRKGNPHIKQH